MVQALIFKEWLKTRWAGLISLLVFVLLLIKTTLNLSYAIRILGANNYWADVFIKGNLFFGDLLYLSALTGIVIAAFQFFPEIAENRLKLTLHLPMPENTILLYMVAFGSMMVLSVLGIAMILLSLITIIYFPIEVLWAVWMTTWPWLLSGLVAYFTTITIFVEPIWFKRLVFMFIGVSFIGALLEPDRFNYFERSIPAYTLVSLLFSLMVLFSAHRFRKGVQR